MVCRFIEERHLGGERLLFLFETLVSSIVLEQLVRHAKSKMGTSIQAEVDMAQPKESN